MMWSGNLVSSSPSPLRRLRSLLGRDRTPTGRVAPARHLGPCPAGAWDAAALAVARAASQRVQCLDMRSAGELAHGIVVGSWLLDPLQIDTWGPALARLPGPWGLMGDARPDDLVAAGLSPIHPIHGGLDTWRAAGFEVREPAWKSPAPVGRHIIVSSEVVEEHGGDALAVPTARGWVQDVHWVDDEFRFDVALILAGRLVRLTALVEEELHLPGGRGAAGLGETI